MLLVAIELDGDSGYVHGFGNDVRSALEKPILKSKVSLQVWAVRLEEDNIYMHSGLRT